MDKGGNMSDLLRDYKSYTSKLLFSEIKNNSQESRKSWMLPMFQRSGKRNLNNKYFQIWQQNNHPVQLSTNKMMEDRLDYLHWNPVKAGIVYTPEHYVYSSAIDYSGGKGFLDVVFIE